MEKLSLRDHYLAGSGISGLGALYHQAQMADQYYALENDDLKQHCKDWIKHVQEKNDYIFQRYLMIEFVRQLKIPKDPNPPSHPKSYQEWSAKVHNEILDRYTGDELSCHLYLYGYCQGDLYSVLVVLSAALDLELTFSISDTGQAANCIKELQTIFPRWASVATPISAVEAFAPFGAAFQLIQSKLRGPIELFQAQPERLALVLDDIKACISHLEEIERSLAMLLPGPDISDSVSDSSPTP